MCLFFTRLICFTSRVFAVSTCFHVCFSVNDSLLPDEKVCQSHSNSDGADNRLPISRSGSRQSQQNTHDFGSPANSLFQAPPTPASPTCATFDLRLFVNLYFAGSNPAPRSAEVEDTVETFKSLQHRMCLENTHCSLRDKSMCILC